MDRELLKQVEGGATVLTASQRLARVLAESFTSFQRDRGRSVWSTPRILPWGGYLRRSWNEAAIGPMLLNPAQEAALWEEIIWQSPAGRTLLRVPETARCAMDAWDLLHAYRLPFPSPGFSVSEDCEAFAGWAAEFERRLASNNWLEPARLSDRVAVLIRERAVERPFPLILAGFDDLTPRDRDLLDALCGATRWTPREYQTKPICASSRDVEAEIRSAAAWSRQRLQSDPKAKIGIVVPDINSMRRKLERLFSEALQAPSAFHISLAVPLGHYPLVDAAVRILTLATGPRPIEEIGLLLRSPFLTEADQERSNRAALDAKLRKEGRSVVSMKDLQAGTCPALHRMLGALDKEFQKLPAEQNPSQWSRSFSRLLRVAGWPGPRTLGSGEHQTVKAWNDLLSTLATLDAVFGRMTLEGALARLRNLGEHTNFQTENEGAPVEIVGLLEASGLRFDHTWVMGLHDGAMPSPARPNPFLPLSFQRSFDMPHSSAARELEFSRKLLGRLAGSAPEVIFSYPEWEGDQPLGPSPLVGQPVASFFQTAGPYPIPRAAMEERQDAIAPPLHEGVEQAGGASTLKDMAACPFRAYAIHRLGARPLEEPALGMDAREKGSGVHRAMQAFWSEVKAHRELCALSPEDLQGAVARAVDAAILDPAALGRTLERKRIQRLMLEWLELEKQRPPFTAIGFEVKRPAVIGGLRINTRVDRVDEVEGGGRILIDYKTGQVSGSAWAGDRMDEPQIPLYCVGEPGPVVAAAFGQIRTGDLQFLGVSEGGELGAMKEMGLEKGLAMEERIGDWARVLEKLAVDFRAGVAPVDPKSHKSCDFCKLTALCRVADAAHD